MISTRSARAVVMVVANALAGTSCRPEVVELGDGTHDAGRERDGRTDAGNRPFVEACGGDSYPIRGPQLEVLVLLDDSVSAWALNGNPSVSTYVFVTLPDLPLLDDLARAGGTGRAIRADLSMPGTLSARLNGVRDQEVAELPCEYVLPPAYFEQAGDPERVNLVHDQRPITKVAGAAACERARARRRLVLRCFLGADARTRLPQHLRCHPRRRFSRARPQLPHLRDLSPRPQHSALALWRTVSPSAAFSLSS